MLLVLLLELVSKALNALVVVEEAAEANAVVQSSAAPNPFCIEPELGNGAVTAAVAGLENAASKALVLAPTVPAVEEDSVVLLDQSSSKSLVLEGCCFCRAGLVANGSTPPKAAEPTNGSATDDDGDCEKAANGSTVEEIL